MQRFPKLTCQQHPTITERCNAATIRFLRRALTDAKAERDAALTRAAAAEARAVAAEQQLADLARGRKRKRGGTQHVDTIISFVLM